MKKIPIIPECYKDLPDSTNLNSKEVGKIFRYKNHKNVLSYCAAGSIPQPYRIIRHGVGVHNINKYYWKLGTIRKWKNDNSI